MAPITCPHNCGVTFDRQHALIDSHNVAAGTSIEDHVYEVRTWKCPRCNEVTIEMVRRGPRKRGQRGITPGDVIDTYRLWPRSSRTPPPQVPPDLSRDFREASEALDISPRASAALSRRCLQQTLVDHVGAKGRDLNAQIDAVDGQLPSHVQEGLHALRNLGNFAAHPIKVQATGQVVDVEPGEAEWTLEVLEQLFDFTLVAPAKAAARMAALNEKLQATGKPTL